MIENIGRLTPADEGLNHQIADTFATVAESDYGWTEKTWGALMRKDGAMTVSFGLGKYHNRNVIDGFGGVSRGSQRHGSWKGAYHEEGDYIADVTAQLQRIGQFRDKPVMVRDGDAVGFGLQESVYSGVFPELGLGAESDFPSDL